MNDEETNLQRIAMESVANVVFVTDRSGKILWVNSAFTQVTGYSPEEAVGQTPRILKSGKQSQSFYENLWKTVLSGNVWHGELTNRRKDGKFYDEELTVTPVFNSRKEITHFVATSKDITERKRMETTLLRMQRTESIGALASGIAHDLNNVLDPILMAVHLLKQRIRDKANRVVLKRVESSATRGLDMVKHILAFAWGTEGERTSVKPGNLIKEIVEIISGRFPRSIRIKTALAADLRNISGDPTQIHQVLLNLCVNARDAMPEGGVLTISAENTELAPSDARLHQVEPGPYVVLSVSDTGKGIPPEILHKIFDPFFTTKSPGQGTGIGLSTVVGIVKGHRGFIDVDSEVGKGTTFKVFIPAEKRKTA